jgi:hypothetical protein
MTNSSAKPTQLVFTFFLHAAILPRGKPTSSYRFLEQIARAEGSGRLILPKRIGNPTESEMSSSSTKVVPELIIQKKTLTVFP